MHLPLQDCSTFRQIVLKSAYMKRKMYEQLLETVLLLKHLEVSHSNGFLSTPLLFMNPALPNHLQLSLVFGKIL